MQVKVSNAAPAVAFDRPNTTADRMGTLMAAFAHHLDANGKPAGVFESGSDPIIVGQAAYNAAYGTSFAASGWCNSPSNPAAKCDGFARIQEQGGDDVQVRHPRRPRKLQIPFQPKGMHDEMNSANFDEWGRMTANLGLEAPGATPLLQNIILYPVREPGDRGPRLHRAAEQPRRDPDLLGRRRHPDLEDHPQRGGHPSDPLPPLRRAGASTG